MVEIRTAGPADLDQLQAVFRRSSLHNDGDRANLLEHPEVLELDPSGVAEQRTRVATEAGRVVGFATTARNGDALELDDLFVDPDFMRRGIGLDLIRDVEEVARAQSVRRVEVTANSHAFDFYQRAGFVVDGTAETLFGPATRMHLDVD